MVGLIALQLLTACQRGDVQDSDVAGEAPVDLRRDFPEPPEGGMQYLSPELVIPAYSERQFCTFFTYEGETVAMNFQGFYQSDYGHHATLNGTNADPEQYPDGLTVDCTDQDSLPMTDLDPLFVGGTSVDLDNANHNFEMSLPEGMGVRLPQGQRVIMQSHYVNTTPDDILVSDAVNVGVVPEDAVQTWVGAYVHINTSFSLPPGESSTVTIDCAWEEEMHILYMTGHMHEWGTSIKVEHLRGDSAETVYDVPTWDPVYRDGPPMNMYEQGEFLVEPGDVFRTTCTWFNDEDRPLEFPAEMCVNVMMVYPSKVPLVCEPD